jgi:hypothetical protein
MINIPQELLQSGKTLTIERNSEKVVGDHQVSQPMHPIPQTHGMCLVDTQRQDQTSVIPIHRLQDNISDSGEFLRTIIFIDVKLMRYFEDIFECLLSSSAFDLRSEIRLEYRIEN